MELGPLGDHVHALMREHAHVDAHVAACPGVNDDARRRARAVGLHDVGGLGRDGVTRDGDDAPVDGGHLDRAHLTDHERADEKDHEAEGAHGEARQNGDGIRLEVEQRRRLQRPRAVPREREGGQDEEVRQREEDHAEALETVHARLLTGASVRMHPRIPLAPDGLPREGETSSRARLRARERPAARRRSREGPRSPTPAGWRTLPRWRRPGPRRRGRR